MAGETLRFTVLGSGDASDLDRLAAAVNRITDQIRDLDRQRANPEIDVETRKAESKIGKFAKDMQRTISRAIESLPDIELDADASDAQREVQAVRAALVELNDKRVGIDIGADEAQRQVAELQARLAALGDVDLDVQLRADTAGAMAQLEAVTGEVDRLDGRKATIKVDVDRGLGDSIIRVAALGKALRTLAIPASLAVAAPQIASLGAAAVQAAGSLALIPAAGAAVATAVAAVKVGLVGVKEALKVRGDAEAFAEALKELAPAAAEFATQVRDLGPAWKDVRLDVQNRLFQDTGATLARLSGAYLPSVQSALGGIADAFNQAGRDSADFLASEETVSRLGPAFDNIKTAVSNAAGALRPLTESFVILVEEGAARLPAMGQAITNVSNKFRDWLSAAQQSGDLGRWIDQGVDAIQQLGRIAGNVGSILGSVFQAASAAGVSFLDTVEKITQGVSDFLNSATGQSALVATFREISAAVDALQPGLAALATGIAQMVSAFAGTGALQAAATALSDLATAIAPLLPALGELAGGALVILSSAVSTAAGAIGPLVSMLTALLDVLGPIGPAVLAMALAFRGLRGVSGVIAGLGTSLGGIATRVGASEKATGRLATAFRGLGTAIPVAGAALVGVIALYEQAASKADESAKAILDGSMSMKQAIDEEVGQLENRNAAYRAANIEGQEFASVQQNAGAASRGLATDQQTLTEATDNQTRAIQEQYDKLSPFEKLQADVAMARRALNDAIAAGDEAGAAAAADQLAAADGRLETAEKNAEAAAAAHNQTLEDRIGAVQTALGATLAMEGALDRVKEAEEAANKAAREHGAGSDEAADANRQLALSADSAAQSAQKQAEQLAASQGATNSADVGARTYAATLGQIAATTSGPAQTAMLGYIDTLSDTELQTLNAQTAALGFKTQLLTLPSGRQITIAVDPETGEIISTQELLATIQDKTITINGNAMPAQQALTTVLSQVAAGAESVTINGETMTAQQALAAVLGMITSSSGTVTINGQSMPADQVLSALIASVNAGSGTVSIGGRDVPAQDVLRALIGSINSGTGTVTLDANGQPVATAKTEAEQPTASPHTLGDPTTDNTGGAKGTASAPTGNPHTVGEPTTDNTGGAKGTAGAPTGNPHTVGEPTTDNTGGAKAGAAAPTGNPHTVGSPVDAGPVDGAKAAASAPSSSMHTINVDDKPVTDAKGRAEQPTSSLHTINCNDRAVTDAKANAQRGTSSTHTIHVRTVGAPIPRAAGAYATPRAKGAYAQPAYMASGGMRSMSSARAEVVPPRQPRVIGDRMRGDEAFIPINRSARSISILNTAANRMGYGLVPAAGRAMASGGLNVSPVVAMPRWAPTNTGGSREGLAREIHALAEELRARGNKDVNIVNNFAIENASQAADEVARTQRVAGALGIFGG